MTDFTRKSLVCAFFNLDNLNTFFKERCGDLFNLEELNRDKNGKYYFHKPKA
jgi:hypothetical protein